MIVPVFAGLLLLRPLPAAAPCCDESSPRTSGPIQEPRSSLLGTLFEQEISGGFGRFARFCASSSCKQANGAHHLLDFLFLLSSPFPFASAHSPIHSDPPPGSWALRLSHQTRLTHLATKRLGEIHHHQSPYQILAASLPLTRRPLLAVSFQRGALQPILTGSISRLDPRSTNHSSCRPLAAVVGFASYETVKKRHPLFFRRQLVQLSAPSFESYELRRAPETL